jgi:pimeloyl-ACP methyl ester carboxylesterase
MKGSLMSKPTIVLVHGAFADASIWQRVYDQLARDGDAVLAPPNPLRGIPYDASYIQSLVRPTELPDGSVEISIDPARFTDVFGADVPADDAAFRAISQRTVAATAFDNPATAAAWREKPSWAVFGTGDLPVAPELHRFSYDRAGSKVTEVDGASHLLMLSQPEIVARVIREAVIACAAGVVA